MPNKTSPNKAKKPKGLPPKILTPEEIEANLEIERIMDENEALVKATPIDQMMLENLASLDSTSLDSESLDSENIIR